MAKDVSFADRLAVPGVLLGDFDQKWSLQSGIDVHRMARDAARTEVPRLAAEIRGAKKYHLDADFIHLAQRFARHESPAMLRTMMAQARPPFDTMWLEWPEFARLRGLGVEPDVEVHNEGMGVLIRKSRLPSFDGWEIVQFHENHLRGGGACSPMGWVFNFTAPVDETRLGKRTRAGTFSQVFGVPEPFREPGDQTMPAEMALGVVGFAYAQEWLAKDGDADIDFLASHAWGIFQGPVGAVTTAVIKWLEQPAQLKSETAVADYDVIKRGLKHLNFECAGLPMLIMVVLALLNIHPVVRHTDVPRGPSRHVGNGKFRPTFEHKRVSLVRPDLAPSEVVSHLAVPSGGADRRLHPVQGHWARSHKLGKEACPHRWVPRVDDEGHRVGSDQQACELCGGRRWWRHDHHRGNALKGVVDKTYDIITERK